MVCGMVELLAIPAQDVTAITCPKGTKHSGQPMNTYADCNLDTTGDNAGSSVMTRINTGINVVLGIIGVVAVIMIILGGIQYTTSQGDAAKATKARNTILYSVVGLIIALLAFAIVNFVLTSVFK